MSPPIWRASRPLRPFSAATPADWNVREVGDGNLNLVFIVEGRKAAWC